MCRIRCRKVQNLVSCGGLVYKSASILSVGQCSILISPFDIRSVTKKYLMLRWQVLQPLDIFPLFATFIVLMLSWYSTLSFMSQPWAARKYLTHNTIGIILSIPTDSASVELLVFNFCFVELEYIAPFPIVITPPVWLLIWWCTENDASAHQRMTPNLAASRVNTRALVAQRYCMSRLSFFQLSLSGCLTRVVRNATAV